MKKILLYWWNTYSDRYLQEQLERLGYQVAIVQVETAELAGVSEKLRERLRKSMEGKGFDAVISYDYFQEPAEVCHEKQIPYISWTQDMPLIQLYHDSIFYDTNYMFCFDRTQQEGLLAKGVRHAYYQPLATDVAHMRRTVEGITEQDRKRYRACVSFVGSTYEDREMTGLLGTLPEYLKGYMEGLCAVQLQVPELRFTSGIVPKKQREELQRAIQIQGMEEHHITWDKTVENVLDRQVSGMERRKLMELLCRVDDFALYTTSDTSEYKGIRLGGKVDYDTQMPKVFALSDININPTMRAIASGIPLRILDVIAAGGFLLTNAQPELYEWFEEGESIAVFHHVEEVPELIDYYLKHETERRRIVENGYRIVSEQFDYPVQLRRILSTVEAGV